MATKVREVASTELNQSDVDTDRSMSGRRTTTKLIVSHKVQLRSLEGPILSRHRCGQCCLLGKYFCSRRVLAHLINGKRSVKYRASNKTNRSIP